MLMLLVVGMRSLLIHDCLYVFDCFEFTQIGASLVLDRRTHGDDVFCLDCLHLLFCITHVEC